MRISNKTNSISFHILKHDTNNLTAQLKRPFVTLQSTIGDEFHINSL